MLSKHGISKILDWDKTSDHYPVRACRHPFGSKNFVDAFIATENTYMGLLKSFLIHDEERTWLKSGFQFFAIHRPELKGTGRDMVIQVDPQTRAHLKDLWDKARTT